MRRANIVRSAVVILAPALVLAIARPAFAEDPGVSNRVVVLVDASGSYRARQADALERAVTLLDGIAARRTHRWEPATDRIAVISLDAMPDVLWEGSVQDLKATDRGAWAARFHARSDYATCTDVSAAFRLAARHLEGDPRHMDKYLFVFTDLIDEPPTTSLRKCRGPERPSLPPNDFPWEALRGVSVTVLWVPPEQTLAWRRAVAEHGLETTFAVHTESESGEIAIAPPPRPVRVPTEAERASSREQIVGKIAGAARAVGVAVAFIAAFLGVIAVVARRYRQRAPRSLVPAESVPLRQPRRPQGSPRPVAPSNVRAAARLRPPRRPS